MALLGRKLQALDLSRAALSYPTPEPLEERMISALPDVVVADPPIDPCFTSRARARWKGIPRRTIARHRRTGKVVTVTINGSVLYPSVQLDNRGRPRSAFREMREAYLDGDSRAFAVWLQTPHPNTGVSPASKPQNAPNNMLDEQQVPAEFEPTIIQPPVKSTGDV